MDFSAGNEKVVKSPLLYLFPLYENRVTDQLIYHHNRLGDVPTISLVAIDRRSYRSFIREVIEKLRFIGSLNGL